MRAVRFSGVLVTVISSAVLIGPGIGSATTGSPAVGAAVACAPGSVLWTSVRAGLGHAVAADPSGGMVFAVGSPGLTAYSAGTGAKLWENVGSGRSVAVSRNGNVVFVVKPVGGIHGADFFTAAFDAATGKRLWARRYNGRASGDDRPVALAVSAGGQAVFVTGTSPGKTSGRDYATVAYAAATGRQLWVSRYSGHGRSSDIPAAIAVSPRGDAVFVTGTSQGRTSGGDFATVAYAAATGAPLWAKRYNGPANRLDAASSVAPSRDGHRVIVAGTSDGRRGSGTDFATIAYKAATGAPLWARRYHGPAERNDNAVAVLASPFGGGTVITVGDSAGNGHNDYVSVAYVTATGLTRWVSRVHRDFQPEFLKAAALSPDGRSFYLTGYVFPNGGGGEEPSDVLTVATFASGAQRWAKEIAPTIANGTDAGLSVAVSPDSSAVYNLVQEFTTRPVDFRTIAFQACN